MAAAMGTLTLLDTPAAAAAWLRARGVRALASDSRAVRAGDAFFAWPGAKHDARRHLRAALDAGAAACLVEADGAEAFDDAADDDRVAAMAGLKAAAGWVADAFHGRPSAKLQLVAVTGTNGKTSTATWVAQALGALGQRCGVVGTLGIGEPGALQATGLTTPDALALHGAMASFVDRGFRACAMEASSIGLVEHRLAGAQIAVAGFTNFTRDHLDYHGSMAAYWAAKRTLFAWPGLRAAVVNIDDEHGARLAAELAREGGPEAWSVSLAGPARLRGQALRYEGGGLVFDVEEGTAATTVRSRLVGDYNASNLLVALGCLRALGVPLADAAAALGTVTPVPGRMQRVAAHGIDVIVDYAHTPDALEKVLAALRPLARGRGGRLLCVFGCGGDRDPTKRPLMGGIAARLADTVIVTSDNPRSEEPQAIVAQVLAGAPGATAIVDRREAIATAVRGARSGDVLLVAGKGHEDYQEVRGVRHPFSDLAEAQAALAALEARGRA
jgi:UDP-N-acetylmuramoyl-L-alanyl-D-glutamate--2,6-diaminopimelate ligase